jgi:NAD(P)-dependent dehydrogenase (short-subunit alcohol dehydrogenase family)
LVTDLARQNNQSEAETAANFVKQYRPGSLLARFASVEEVANVVVFVASKEAAVTNGAAIRAEGGYHRLRRAQWRLIPMALNIDCCPCSGGD